MQDDNDDQQQDDDDQAGAGQRPAVTPVLGPSPVSRIAALGRRPDPIVLVVPRSSWTGDTRSGLFLLTRSRPGSRPTSGRPPRRPPALGDRVKPAGSQLGAAGPERGPGRAQSSAHGPGRANPACDPPRPRARRERARVASGAGGRVGRVRDEGTRPLRLSTAYSSVSNNMGESPSGDGLIRLVCHCHTAAPGRPRPSPVRWQVRRRGEWLVGLLRCGDQRLVMIFGHLGVSDLGTKKGGPWGPPSRGSKLSPQVLRRSPPREGKGVGGHPRRHGDAVRARTGAHGSVGRSGGRQADVRGESGHSGYSYVAGEPSRSRRMFASVRVDF